MYLGMCINTHIHMYVRTMKIGVINFVESKDRSMGGFERRRGKVAIYIIIKKRKNF